MSHLFGVWLATDERSSSAARRSQPNAEKGRVAEAGDPDLIAVVWLLLIQGSYKVAERIFVLMTIPFFAYPIAAILAKPHWGRVGKAIVAPHFQLNSGYVFLFIATAGTTITPFMQLYVPRLLRPAFTTSSQRKRGTQQTRIGDGRDGRSPLACEK